MNWLRACGSGYFDLPIFQDFMASAPSVRELERRAGIGLVSLDNLLKASCSEAQLAIGDQSRIPTSARVMRIVS